MNTTTNTFTKSELMTAYNQICAISRKANNYLDRGRINKAFGILQSKAGLQRMIEEYGSTRDTCSCKDQMYFYAKHRKDSKGNHYTGPCKHSIAIMILEQIMLNRENAYTPAATATSAKEE